MGTQKWSEIKKLSKATEADRAEARAELAIERSLHATGSGTVGDQVEQTWGVWKAVCPHAPIAHDLRGLMRDRWVRFHSLPGSKRYPETEAEMQIVLSRANSVVAELCQSLTNVLVVTGFHAEPKSSPVLSEEQLLVHGAPKFWTEVYEEPREVDSWPMHLWTSWEQFQPGSLDRLFRLTAEDQLYGVLVIVPDTQAIVHPYDGGIDVFPRSRSERDRFRHKFRDWLSARDDGL
jgi:hypothetical protein